MVEPRLALGALRAHLATARRALPFPSGLPRRRAEPHALVDTTGARWEGDLAVLATGAAYDHLPGTRPLATRLRRVRLQMLQTAPFPATPHDLAGRLGLAALLPGLRAAPLAQLGAQTRWPPHTICSCCWSSAPTAG